MPAVKPPKRTRMHAGTAESLDCHHSQDAKSVASMAASSAAGFLAGVKVCMLRGSCESEAHRQRRKQLIRDHGGQSHSKPRHGITHYLCSASASEAELRCRIAEECGNAAVSADAVFVTSTWLGICLQTGRLQPAAM